MNNHWRFAIGAVVLVVLVFAWRGPALLGWAGVSRHHCYLLYAAYAQTEKGAQAALRACAHYHP